MWVTTKRGIVPIYNWKGVMADEILYGMEAELSEEQAGGFCKIKTEYGYEGYAKSECFIWDIEVPKNLKFVIWPYADVLMHPINEIDLKPGDLIYYEGHVTMYIGDGEYIHATGRAGSDAVVINSLNEGSSNYREDLATWPKVCASLF